MIKDFVEQMRRCLPADARLVMCQFRGDPGDDAIKKWRAYVLNDVDQIDEKANVYLCVSAMRKNERGEFRRRKENFAGGLLLMIDDLGDGAGSKFPLSLIEAAPPTALIETSPGNFQAVYMFDKLIDDMRTFEALIRAFIDKQFLGKDTGMAGVNRVFRPPAGVNGKPKYGGWSVRLAEWSPERRYSVGALVAAFGLKLALEGRKLPRGATADKAANIREFVRVRRTLLSAGLLRNIEADVGGWTQTRCPWVHEHTGMANNGAAIRLPDEDNAFFGAFKCHHGACSGRGWRDLTDWLASDQEEVLDMINSSAGEFGRWSKNG